MQPGGCGRRQPRSEQCRKFLLLLPLPPQVPAVPRGQWLGSSPQCWSYSRHAAHSFHLQQGKLSEAETLPTETPSQGKNPLGRDNIFSEAQTTQGLFHLRRPLTWAQWAGQVLFAMVEGKLGCPAEWKEMSEGNRLGSSVSKP